MSRNYLNSDDFRREDQRLVAAMDARAARRSAAAATIPLPYRSLADIARDVGGAHFNLGLVATDLKDAAAFEIRVSPESLNLFRAAYDRLGALLPELVAAVEGSAAP